MDLNPRDYRAWYGLGQTYELLHMPFYALFYFRWCVLRSNPNHGSRAAFQILYYFTNKTGHRVRSQSHSDRVHIQGIRVEYYRNWWCFLAGYDLARRYFPSALCAHTSDTLNGHIRCNYASYDTYSPIRYLPTLCFASIWMGYSDLMLYQKILVRSTITVRCIL